MKAAIKAILALAVAYCTLWSFFNYEHTGEPIFVVYNTADIEHFYPFQNNRIVMDDGTNLWVNDGKLASDFWLVSSKQEFNFTATRVENIWGYGHLRVISTKE